MSFETIFIISIAAEFVGAMSGMGGGVVLIPALTLLGLDIKHAIAASMISVIATSSGSASAYVRDRITNLKVGMFLEMFTILGAIAGASITLASGHHFLFILFGIVLLFSCTTLFFQHTDKKLAAAHQDKFSHWLELEGSYYDQAVKRTIRYEVVRAYLGGPLMFGAGLVAGLLGIGAGALKVLIFDLVMGLPPKVSTTTSNLIIMDTLVGYILLVGVLLSMALILIGEIWHWANTGSLALDYSISGHSFFGFLLSNIRQLFSGVFRPRLLTSLGIAVLLLTPYVRVLQ